MPDQLDYHALLSVAIEEARKGLSEMNERGEFGIPIGAAMFDSTGQELSRGHNRRVQEDDPSIHGETDAFRKAGRQRKYSDKIMVTTLAPCWYCSGLIKQFGIGTVVVGENENFKGGLDWLRKDLGTKITVEVLDSRECIDLLADYIARYPQVWNEDIGKE